MAGKLPPAAITVGVHQPRPQPHVMPEDKAVKQMRRRKGAQTIQRTGQAHRWTPERAQKAAQKRWRHTRHNRATGKHFVRLAKRPAMTQAMRETIRAEHSNLICSKDNLWFCQRTGQWWSLIAGTVPERVISERAALVRLGHLRNYRGYVPDKIIGTNRAKQRKP